MITIHERNAAFDAVKHQLDISVPWAFKSYIHDDMVLKLVDAALSAAEKVRHDTPDTVKK